MRVKAEPGREFFVRIGFWRPIKPEIWGWIPACFARGRFENRNLRLVWPWWCFLHYLIKSPTLDTSLEALCSGGARAGHRESH